MRSPVIAFGIFAATVSPSLIAAAPTPQVPSTSSVTSVKHTVTNPLPAGLASAANGGNVTPPADPSVVFPHSRKRADDAFTAGGNAHTGNAGNSDGGRILNEADNGEDLTSDDSNFGGDGDSSESGDAEGGDGDGRGPGGNAMSGNAGTARGGTIFNSGESVDSTGASNIPGVGGTSRSGDVEGGDAKRKRAFDSGTAGGNAHSGDSSSTSAGSVFNVGEQNGVEEGDGEITNTASNNAVADSAGTSETGDAEGGRGRGRGPGGNATTGNAGPSNGSNIGNSAGVITSTGSNTGSDGGTSTSGDAEGGNAIKRAFDGDTAGGNAHTGDSSNVNGGSVENVSEPDGTITNTASTFGGDGGDTTTGDADGGSGNDLGPGGNASTGNSGDARGGSVANFGGTINNTGGSNIAGDGGTSSTGTATGGNVSGSGFGDDDDEDFGPDDFDFPDRR